MNIIVGSIHHHDHPLSAQSIIATSLRRTASHGLSVLIFAAHG
jgi:hypothetical protein